jgi:CxxC motif-containing protein (DUF1111 family)
MRSMIRTHRVCYLLVLMLAVVPAGLRALSWRTAARPVDAEMAQAGETLFNHEWYVGDPLCTGGDGLGPVFNATSCVACHHQGGVGGSGGLEHNVTLFTVAPASPGESVGQGVIHARATHPTLQETLSLVDPSLPAISQPRLNQLIVLRGDGRQCVSMPANVQFSQRNTPALFGSKLIDEIPDRVLIGQERREQMRLGPANADDETRPAGRVARLSDGRIGKFGWKGQSASLADFVQAACANELGLGNPGQAQPRSLAKPSYEPAGLDLTQEQCDQIAAFCASLSRPKERLKDELTNVEAGKRIFSKIGCADCHVPNLGSIEGLYSDLLLHRMGKDLVGGGSYGERPRTVPDLPIVDEPQPNEWRTPPLWGVADSAPYLHDGRAATLEEAIQMHGGQGRSSADRFRALSSPEQAQLIAFLSSLCAPHAD